MMKLEEYKAVEKQHEPIKESIGNGLALSVEHVTVQWQGKQTLNDVSLRLEPAQHLLITGKSGSGKTLLAKAIAGQLFHAGTIQFLQDTTPVKPITLLVEQHYNFKNLSNVSGFYYQQRFNSIDANDALTVLQELLKTGHPENDIHRLLQKFDITHRQDSPLLHLSSGEHKRLQIIKALLQHPDVLILDEPFLGLDINTRVKLQASINELAAEGKGIIVICHPQDAPTCITHIAEMEEGKLIQCTPASEYKPTESTTNIAKSAIPEEPTGADFFNAITFKDVSVKYGDKQILSNISWQVAKADRWLLKGHNGAGKSTLLSLITGDNPQAYANEIYLFDKRRGSGESIWDIKKQIGYVSPELQWYFDTTISCKQAVASGLFDTIGLFRQLSSSQQEKLDKWMDYFGLKEYATKRLAVLPAGIQRLTLLARAMVKNPPLLILDEPCQGLDLQQKNDFLQIVNTLCANNSRTLIYVSHYAEDIPACVDKTIELNKGIATIHTSNK